MTYRLAMLFVLAGALSGCGKRASDEEGKEPIAATPTLTVKSTTAQHPAGHERLHQSFKEAMRAEPLRDSRPPDKTMTGKSIGRLYEEVLRQWDGIKFMNADGSRLHYRATLDTSLGPIEIALDDEHAPNHVRNFIALSRAGFYDGLEFDHIFANEHYEELQAGSPLGAEDPTKNSLGYWLKPEIRSELKHEPGAIGACHAKEKDTAGCKFYIALTSASDYDGNYTLFGKVTRGLDVAERIGRQPVIIDEEDPSGIARPLEPVVIRKVIIHTRNDQ